MSRYLCGRCNYSFSKSNFGGEWFEIGGWSGSSSHCSDVHGGSSTCPRCGSIAYQI